MRHSLRSVMCVGVLAAALTLHAQVAKPAKVYFAPVVINNVATGGAKAKYPINEPELRKALSAQFDAWVVRSVTRNNLSPNASPVGTSKPKQGELLLQAVLDIPLTHDADMSHWDNQNRRGKFMSYRFSLSDVSGKVVLDTKGELTWGDGEWSRFMGRGRHADNAHEEVIKAYVRKAVDRGVLGLKKQLK